MRETISPRVPANSVRAPSRAHVPAIVAILMLVLGISASASPPLRETGHQDDTVPLPGATARCGFPIYARFEGDYRYTVFYRDGVIVSEIDTFPSFRITV